jgi:hypothetical protein
MAESRWRIVGGSTIKVLFLAGKTFNDKILSIFDDSWCSEKLTPSSICVTFYILEKKQKRLSKLGLKRKYFTLIRVWGCQSLK